MKYNSKFHLFELESPSPKDALSHVWLKLAPWILRRRFKSFKARVECLISITASAADKN